MWDNKVRDMVGQQKGSLKVWIQVVIFLVCAIVVFLIDYLAMPMAMFPFFPPTMCMAYLEAPVDNQAGCSPCNGMACASPCPNGVCPEGGVVGPCPRQEDSPPPIYGYANVTDPMGPACAEKIISPGDIGTAPAATGPRFCPTGIPPVKAGEPAPPAPFKVLSAVDYCLEVCPANTCGKGVPTDGEMASLKFVSALDNIVLAIGITYAIVRGMFIFKLQGGKLKKNAIYIYSTLTFQLVVWWPHLRLHGQFSSPVAIALLDVFFHMPTGLSALVLLYYVDKSTQNASEWEWPFKHKFLTRPLVHMYATLIFGNICFAVGWSVGGSCTQAFEGFLSPALGGLVGFVYWVEAIMMGCALASLVFCVPTIRALKFPENIVKCSVLYVALLFMIGNWFPHITLHNTMPAPWFPSDFLALDIGFHLPIIISILVIMYNMNILLQMAIMAANSAQRYQSVHDKSASIASGLKSKQSQQSQASKAESRAESRAEAPESQTLVTTKGPASSQGGASSVASVPDAEAV